MKKRPMCLVCLGLALGIWLMRLAGLPVFGEPEKGQLEMLLLAAEYASREEAADAAGFVKGAVQHGGEGPGQQVRLP